MKPEYSATLALKRNLMTMLIPLLFNINLIRKMTYWLPLEQTDDWCGGTILIFYCTIQYHKRGISLGHSLGCCLACLEYGKFPLSEILCSMYAIAEIPTAAIQGLPNRSVHESMTSLQASTCV